MLKTLHRNCGLKYLTENIGKVKKSGLKSLRVPVENGEEVTCQNRDIVHEKIRNKNIAHFSKVKSSHACKDKIYDQLLNDRIRDKITRGTIRREDCDNKETCKFLK